MFKEGDDTGTIRFYVIEILYPIIIKMKESRMQLQMSVDEAKDRAKTLMLGGYH